ncbi:glucuronate isomerase [Paenibacillus qinlingensis]|uniref:Glucuronate isomerase n=1 Tax=Paenibacillus qinlingensis TaxID=1837343 RepID=A0ABU1P063_9BACL|nr:glucuronate isomerase [Paenibacillus qinlingensis]MDR6553103.1 glucuronate isomerase [Paenibacillus qinlingensis]
MNRQMKQGKEILEAQIMQLPVVDTHTHLVGDRLCAGDFWEIAHYFWLFRELQAAGYPANAMELPEDERITAFLEAYHGSKNTMMNIAMTHMFKHLYGIVIDDASSVREADAAVKQSAGRSTWAQEVADRLHVSRFVVNIPEHADFQGMRDNAILIPRIDGKLGGWTKEVQMSPNPAEAFVQASGQLAQLLDSYKEAGYVGIMTTLPSYEASANCKVEIGPDSTKDEILMMLLHELGAAAEQRGLLIQLFLGVERSWCGTATPVNDPARILKLSALFDTYARCTFELVVASELNNLDIVQAAWNFPNVHVGGHWWFNFRTSTYRDSMQYRLEALPAIKSSLIVSDARCIEWSYGKIWLVKKIMSDFLWGQIESGWIDYDTAIYVAENWLYSSAAKRYGVSKS